MCYGRAVKLSFEALVEQVEIMHRPRTIQG